MIAATILTGRGSLNGGCASYQVDLAPDLPVRIAWGAKDRLLPFTAYDAP